MAAPDHVDAVLRDGAGRAAAIAAPVIKEVHEIVGFLGS
jgi:tryptophanyl-tRNA synthetase